MKYITSADIQALLREGKKELVLGEQDKLTDVVRGMVKHYGIQITRGAAAYAPSGAPAAAVSAAPVSAAPSLGVSEFPGTGDGADYDLVIINGIVVLPESGRVQTNVCVRNGKVAALTSECPSARRVIDARGKYVFPGIIDPHTHLGLYAPLETELETETRSALLGGVTTIGTFLNHTGSYLPTIAKLSREIPQYSRINIIPHFTLRDDEQLRELPLYSARGMNSFKVYMCGVKGIYPHQDDGFILDAMQRLKALPADPVLCIHAENTYIVDRAEQLLADQPMNDLEQWRKTHPNIAEGEAVLRCAYLGGKTGVRTYVVHQSSKESMEVLSKAKHERFYVETTSPYLTRDTSSKVGAYGKMLPPFREPESRLALWDGIRKGLIDTIGTDNVTMTSAEKKMPQGMAGADAGYPALGTHLVSVLNEGFFRQEIPLEKLVPLITMNPAKIFGVYPKKGTLLPGADADIVIVDMETVRRADPKTLQSRSDFSLFQGEELRGWPVCTIQGGRIAALDGRIVDDALRGEMLQH